MWRGTGDDVRLRAMGSDLAFRQRGQSLRAGVRIEARDLHRVTRDGRPILDGVSFTAGPGEVVAIVGGSGAGKTTLLEALAGVRPADAGAVRFDGADLYADLAAFRTTVGYVPQEDIIHAELPLRRTLEYAAGLRLPAGGRSGDRAGTVERVLAALGLSDQADVRVAALSGGQRKRASIAVELLADPPVLFLDEPTSGLDPATAAELVALLRHLADEGATVVFTTHAMQDLARCDRVTLLGRGGRLLFAGPPDAARAHFGVERFEEIYATLADDDALAAWAQRWSDAPRPARPAEAPAEAREPRPATGVARQWTVLTRRTFETMARNRLTMAIMLGAPAMVVAMFAILFRPGAFDAATLSPSAITMILFWITFGAFFFGLTYGLLQITTELAIVRREHLVGLRLGAYVAAKVTVLLPFLLAVVVAMLVVLRLLDRLPPASPATYLSVGVGLSLDAAAALGLGLLASAAVTTATQATLALPMLCFPAVLFSGAILPVHVMAGAGAAISTAVPVRWAFEAVGRDLGIRELLAGGASPLGPPLLESYGDAGTQATGLYWLYLAAFTGVFLVGTWSVLRLRLRRWER